MLDKMALAVALLMAVTMGIGAAFAEDPITQTTQVTSNVASVTGMTVTGDLNFPSQIPGTTSAAQIVNVASQCNDRWLAVYVKGDNFAGGPPGVGSWLIPNINNLKVNSASVTTSNNLVGTHSRMLGVNYPFTMYIDPGTPGGVYTTTLTWTGIPGDPMVS